VGPTAKRSVAGPKCHRDRDIHDLGLPISDGYVEPGAVQSANLIVAQTVSQSAHETAPAASLANPGLHYAADRS
jgi:hypothetical protein